MIRRTCLAAAAVLLAACGKSPGGDPAPPVTATATVAPAAVEAASATSLAQRIRGNAIMGKDGYGIVACGESSQRILEIDPAAQPFLDKFLEGGAREFFVEAKGEDGAGGHLRVLHFDRLYTEGPGCKAPLEDFGFLALGNEPFWAVVDDKNGLRLERPGESALVASARRSRQEGGDWIAEGDTASGPLSLRLAPGFCSDGMSDALYAWDATVRLGELELKGCGFPGLAPLAR